MKISGYGWESVRIWNILFSMLTQNRTYSEASRIWNLNSTSLPPCSSTLSPTAAKTPAPEGGPGARGGPCRLRRALHRAPDHAHGQRVLRRRGPPGRLRQRLGRSGCTRGPARRRCLRRLRVRHHLLPGYLYQGRPLPHLDRRDHGLARLMLTHQDIGIGGGNANVL